MNDFGPKRPMSEDALCESTDTVKAKRGRPKKKPGYDRAEVIDELLVKAVEFFGTPFDDREERPEDAPTIMSVADALQITPIKVRKMLITTGYYSTVMSRRIQTLRDKGYSIQAIMEETGLGKASVNGYLPYTKGVYKLDSPTLYAEQGRLFRLRKAACESLWEHMETENAEMYLWETIEVFSKYPFVTEKGLPLKYTVRGGEIFFNRKEKSVTKATVMKAFRQARQIQAEKGFVKGPKELGTFGASYLYPVFLRIGVCKKSPDKK
ncbi:MAG: hypothetical protein ACLVDL_05520 [Faecalibacterium prausnitzii]|jgi:hypothetical protein